MEVDFSKFQRVEELLRAIRGSIQSNDDIRQISLLASIVFNWIEYVHQNQ